MARRPVRNCKRHNLAALAASVAVTAVVSVISVEMSPARIGFSITSATRSTSGGGDGGVELSITVAADNSSPRASVLYRSIHISVCNSTSRYYANCIGADMATPMPLLQKPNSTELIHAAVELEGADSPWVALGVLPRQQDFMSVNISSAVYVSALVTFKRPVISWTGLYDVNVSCIPVTFISQANQSRAGTVQRFVVNCAV